MRDAKSPFGMDTYQRFTSGGRGDPLRHVEPSSVLRFGLIPLTSSHG
jgi:hypothetical protein